jgi:rhamnosyltransferase
LKISVIIPVRNGAQTLGLCLNSLSNQTLKDQIEIIVLDSMSGDASCALAKSYGARIIHIPDGTFDHGLTRNIGVQHASGALIYFTVQDAWLASNDMLEKMAMHFEAKEIMGVMGHQAIPHEMDKNPFLWYRPVSAPGITEKRVTSREDFLHMPAKKQQAMVSWDNVVAMYRKDALIEQPFVKTAFAEDWIWSYQALLKGWKLIHDSSLVVYHYHHQTFRYVFNTGYTINYHFYKFFNYKPELPALLKPMAQATYHLLKSNILSPREKLYWIHHNLLGRLSIYISTVNFLVRLKTGGVSGVDKGYQKYCNSIPQGQLKK